LPVINALTDIVKLVDLIEEKVPEVMPFVNGLEHCDACGSNCRELASHQIPGELIKISIRK
jgi:molybdopterin-guanine dinucleotide biosynthesis protein B